MNTENCTAAGIKLTMKARWGSFYKNYGRRFTYGVYQYNPVEKTFSKRSPVPISSISDEGIIP